MTETEGYISILMAAYNAEKTIEEAIRSVMDQSYPHWELIVIDDCSTDRTGEIIAAFAAADPRIRSFRNETNRGVSRTRERGLDVADGAWIAVLDSDDLWAPKKLEKQLALAERSAGELLFTGSAFMDGKGKKLDWQLHVPATLTYRELLKQNLISNSSVLVRKELYRQFYALGDEMHEDFAVWLGITKTGRMAYGIDEPLLIYRLSESSKSHNKARAARMNWNTYRYIGLDPFEAAYYMAWYILRGLMKYRNLR